jgi:hypothetical protein
MYVAVQAAQLCPTSKGRWGRLVTDKPKVNTALNQQHYHSTNSASCSTATAKKDQVCPPMNSAPASPPMKQKLDPKDFMFVNMSSTQMVKLPG